MATKKELEDMLKALVPLLDDLKDIEDKYKNILSKYRGKTKFDSEEDREDAAAEMMRKYSNL